MLATFLLNVDPVLIHIVGPISIRWYGIAYMLGFSIGHMLLLFLNNRSSSNHIVNKQILDDLTLNAALSIVIGGRIGYVLFYDFKYYSQDPFAILRIWEGGMSFHGGLIGIVVCIWLLCKKYRISCFKLGDLIVCVVPVGLFFGRIANFINSELYGRVTTVPWAVIFPKIDYLPRHPSQLYEAFLEGALLFLIMIILLRFKSKILENEGRLSCIFLILYGVFRIIAENYREPDVQIGFIAEFFTLGQILSLPLIILGATLMLMRKNKKNYFNKEIN